jgi:hypothetical protein
VTGEKVSEATDQAGSRFVFEINEDDDRIFRKTSARDLRRYVDRRIVKGIPILCVVCIGGALLLAQERSYASLGVVSPPRLHSSQGTTRC